MADEINTYNPFEGLTRSQIQLYFHLKDFYIQSLKLGLNLQYQPISISNKELAREHNRTITSISRDMSKLVKLDFIRTDYKSTSRGIIRRIWIEK